MRFLHAVLFVSIAACATTSNHSGPVNVGLVRHEIADEIHDNRAIVSMGHVDHQRAVVYTKSADNARHEETWVRGERGWTLSTTSVLADN